MDFIFNFPDLLAYGIGCRLGLCDQVAYGLEGISLEGGFFFAEVLRHPCGQVRIKVSVGSLAALEFFLAGFQSAVFLGCRSISLRGLAGGRVHFGKSALSLNPLKGLGYFCVVDGIPLFLGQYISASETGKFICLFRRSYVLDGLFLVIHHIADDP